MTRSALENEASVEKLHQSSFCDTGGGSPLILVLSELRTELASC